MTIYRYTCGKPREDRCKLANMPEAWFNGEDVGTTVDLGFRLMEHTDEGTVDIYKSPVIWYEQHRMMEDPEIKCPVCEGKAIKLVGNCNFYFPGNCYLNKRDCQRQMNLHKLVNDDPYGHFRPEGDKEELIRKIKRGDKAEPKQFFPGGSSGLNVRKPDYLGPQQGK